MRNNHVRSPAVAGLFYPGEPDRLNRLLDEYLLPADREKFKPPLIIIVPHAGYVYSGTVAGRAYSRLLAFPDKFRKILLMGPSHHLPFKGLSVPTYRGFRTPLGLVPLDTSGVARLVEEFPRVFYSDAAHMKEHSLEVQLPFLQKIIPEFSIIPVTVGDSPPGDVALLISTVLSDRQDTLVVISTDLSHYHSYETACILDKTTAGIIETFSYHMLNPGAACGFHSLRGCLKFAGENGLKIERLALANSGDTAGPRDQVVGYGAWKLYHPCGEGFE